MIVLNKRKENYHEKEKRTNEASLRLYLNVIPGIWPFSASPRPSTWLDGFKCMFLTLLTRPQRNTPVIKRTISQETGKGLEHPSHCSLDPGR